MIESGTVLNDASNINTLFNKFENSINTLSDSLWQGNSKNNFVLKCQEMVGEFKDTINSQLTTLADAIVLYQEYKKAKQEYEVAEQNYNAAIAAEDSESAEKYRQIMQQYKAKMEELKPQIISMLDGIKSQSKTNGKMESSNGTSGSIQNKNTEFVNYYQTDYKQSYGYGETIASAGCGPTSMAMVLTNMTDQKVTPEETANYSLKNGYRVQGSGTAWAYFKDISGKYGLNCEETKVSAEKIKSDLSSGKKIIMSMGPGTFTKRGHYIVLTGMNSDGTINVADPASKARSAKSYNIGVFTKQGKKQWAFS